jgi:hypothetical protein
MTVLCSHRVTANLCSFTVTILLWSELPTYAVLSMCYTLAVTQRFFSPAGEKQIKMAYLGSYTDSFSSSDIFASQQNFYIE